MSGSDTLVQHDVISHELNDTWVLYAHLPHDTDWTLTSYKKILTIKTVEQIIAICEELPEPMIQNCMLFLMRENIKPIWEDKENFNNLMSKASKNMIELASIIEDADDIRGTLSQLMWSNCKSCHSKYRAEH